ncbi:MAG: peptidyl-prolyl cis-trans isomerase [Myxococcaceae bacterium]
MKANPLLHLLSFVSALALAACSRSQDQVTFDLRRSSQGTPVASYNGGVITVEDVNKALGQLPPMLRMRYQTPAAKKEFIERLITLDLLAREAVATGHAKDPEVVESVKNVLAQRVVKEERDKQAPPVSDDEVKAWYDGHTQDFTRPETWRVSTLFLAIPAGDAAKKTAQDAKAAKLLAQAHKLKPDDFTAFGALVKANSEDPSKNMEGDLRALTAVELSTRYGPEVAAAVEALKQPGELTALVHSRTGVQFLKLRAHTPQTQTPLADVKGQIHIRLQNERRNQAYEKFLADLKTKANLKVDDAALAKVLVDASPRPEEAPGAAAHPMGQLPVSAPRMPAPAPSSPAVPQAPPAKP